MVAGTGNRSDATKSKLLLNSAADLPIPPDRDDVASHIGRGEMAPPGHGHVGPHWATCPNTDVHLNGETMRTTRLIAVGTALALGGALTTGPASAADGVGTTTVNASLLSVQLGNDGSLLDLRLLGDSAKATIDPKVSSPEAFSRLTALSLSSSVLPAPLNSVSLPSPPFESRSPGGTGNVSTAAIDLANPAAGVSVPAALLSGVVAPATLSSAVDAAGARSALDNTLANLAVAGGLLSAESVSSSLGAASNANKADASRLVASQAITVLDLGALLDGLGLTIADLPVGTVTAILDQLGVPAGSLAAGDLDGAVDDLNAAVDGLQALVAAQPDPADTAAAITGSLPVGLDTVLNEVNAPVPVPSTDTIADVQGTIDALQATLGDVLADAMTALDGLKLLEVDGVEVGTIATAAPALGDSVSKVTGKVGQIRVGGLALPEVDLADTAAQVNAAVAQVNSVISTALGAVSPSLQNLVSVEMFKRDGDNGTGTTAGYNRSIAGVTAVAAAINPPADLVTTVTGIVAGTGIGEEITALGGTVPGLSTAMSTLETVLGSVDGSLQALAGGAAIEVGSLRSVADFTSVAAPEAPRELPRTGSNSTAAMAAFGALLAALAVGVRRTMTVAARDQ